MTPRLLGLLLLGALARAQEIGSLADLLPPETPLYFETRQPTKEEQQRMVIYRCMREPALEAALRRMSGSESAVTSMDMPVGPSRISLGVDLSCPTLALDIRYSDVRGTRTVRIENRIAFAVAGLLPGAMPFDAVLALEAERDPGDALQVLQRMAASASLAARDEPLGDVDAELARMFQPFSHGGVAGVSARIERVEFFAAPIDRFVVIATSESRLKEMIDRRKEPGSRPSLSSDPRHRRALSNLPGEGTCTFLAELHLAPAIEAVASRFPQQAAVLRNILSVTGGDSLQSVIFAARAEETGVLSTTSLLFDGAKRGIGSLFDEGPAGKFDGLAFAPKETLYVTAGRFNPAELVKALRGSIGFPVVAAESWARQMLGFEPVQDLLEHLGPEGTLIVSLNHGLIPDIGLVADVKDAKTLAFSIEKALERVPWPEGTRPLRQSLGGVDVIVVPLGVPEFHEVPLAPTLGFVDGKLLLTPFPLSFQRFLAVKRGERPSLASNADFAALRPRVPKEALAVSYLDLRRIIGIYYDTFMPILQGFPSPNGAIYELPEADIFLKDLYGRIGWRVADASGCHWRSHSPIESGSLFLGAGIGAAAALGVVVAKEPKLVAQVPAAERGARDAEGVRCVAQVRILRARLLMQRESSGSFPAAIEDLRASHIPPETFLVPGSGEPYVYLGPAGRGSVLLHGRPNGRDRAVTVLTTDFEVRRVSEAELAELLK